MFDQLNYEDFSGIVDSDFRVADAEKDIKLRLFEISEKKETPQMLSFSLLFKGPGNILLEQGYYKFEHEKLGEGSLFVVPVQQDTDGLIYEAAFNRYIED